MRYFNTAGPVNCEEHYCLNPLERGDLDEILFLIEQKKYFVLHAPRQTGKTSCLIALMESLNREGRYTALYCNVEAAQGAREDVKRGIKAILNEIALRARMHLNEQSVTEMWPAILENSGEDNALSEVLTRWTEQLQKPLVLLVDEIDALIGDTLISVLRQIRSGYDRRPTHFPQSVILCGVRDVRDYRIHSDKEKAIISGGSAFNIKAASLRLGNFTEHDVRTLLQEHVAETGQPFDAEAEALIWEYSQGQPWLVNALAYETCFHMKSGRDRATAISESMIIEAKENLIVRRETHLDQLADKLREARVRSVIEPLLTGTPDPGKILEDDMQYAVDLGLVQRKPHLAISNPIYREVIPRMLAETTQDVMPFESRWYISPGGCLEMDKLLTAFQEFFREHSEIWLERFDYKEAGPHLLLQAFLQRIINSGGRIDREYGLGKRRADLLIHWKTQKIVIELKILYKSLERTLEEGLEQTADYMDKSGASEGHLVIFDRRPAMKWEQKIFKDSRSHGTHTIGVWGM